MGTQSKRLWLLVGTAGLVIISCASTIRMLTLFKWSYPNAKPDNISVSVSPTYLSVDLDKISPDSSEEITNWYLSRRIVDQSYCARKLLCVDVTVWLEETPSMSRDTQIHQSFYFFRPRLELPTPSTHPATETAPPPATQDVGDTSGP